MNNQIFYLELLPSESLNLVIHTQSKTNVEKIQELLSRMEIILDKVKRRQQIKKNKC